MNNQILINAAREILKELLDQCSGANYLTFQRIYRHNDIGEHVHDSVDKMNPNDLDKAINQAERTLKDKFGDDWNYNHVENKYSLAIIPMNEIDKEARNIACAWIEGFIPTGGMMLREKHKLASDIMNYARQKK